MNRRGFLKGLLGAAAGVAVDPEKLLWVPGQRKIFIPPALYAPYKFITIDSVSSVFVEDEKLMHEWQAYLVETISIAFRVPPEMILPGITERRQLRNEFTGEVHEIQNIRRVVGESQGTSPLERFRQIEGRSRIQRRS